VIFLIAFGLFQAFSMAAIMVWFAGADAALAPCFFTLLSVQLGGLASGLFFSTIAKSSKVALLWMLGWLVLMIAFSGFVVKLPSLRDKGMEWLLGPSSMRWGMGGLMDAVQDIPVQKVSCFGFSDEVWQLNVGVNGALFVFFIAVTMLVLRFRDKV
jgi:hypothetical protein